MVETAIILQLMLRFIIRNELIYILKLAYRIVEIDFYPNLSHKNAFKGCASPNPLKCVPMVHSE